MFSDDIHIVLVDDDQLILAMYSDFLSKHGYKMTTLSNGEAAIEFISNNHKNIDLVVTDILMAKINGWELLDYIRKELGLGELDLPVIVMSAIESIDLDMQYIKHKANEWIIKPIKPLSKLIDKIRLVLGLQGVKGTEHDNISTRSGL